MQMTAPAAARPAHVDRLTGGDMNCPVCGTALMATDRQGIEIDHCPRCRGVWLDRGELDKLIERSTAHYASRGYDDDDSDWGDDRRRHGGHPPPGGHYPPPGAYPPKKKKGFFGSMFDFD